MIPVGDAFQLAVDQGLVKTGGFYDANGVYVPEQPGEAMNLWWYDYLHASKYGSYLDALVQFGTITGLNPLSLGADEQAAQGPRHQRRRRADAAARRRAGARDRRRGARALDLGAARRRPAPRRPLLGAPRARRSALASGTAARSRRRARHRA